MLCSGVIQMKVGIPRAMSFYYYYPFYRAFLETLGAEVVVSTPTTRGTLNRLTDCPTDEPCISVKLLFPHANELIRRNVDAIFLPVLSSGSAAGFFCPKHTGIPFMLKNALVLPDDFLLSPRLDYRDPAGEMSSFAETARNFFGAGKVKAREAYRQAELAQRKFVSLTSTNQITAPEAFSILDGKETAFTRKKPYNPYLIKDPQLRIGIVAHSYTLYDYIGQNLVQRLREYGTVLTPEMVRPQDACQAISSIHDGAKLWSFEIQMLGSALYWLYTGSVERLIFLSPFGCGPEAVMESFLEKEAAQKGVPLLNLLVDEQTGEAGLVTRLEAFMDTSTGQDLLAANNRKKSEVKQRVEPRVGPRVEPHIDRLSLKKEKILGIPSMGHLNKVLEPMFKELGTEVISPPLTQKTVEKGLELAPEFICYPMVVTLGQMRQALEEGANTILMVGGKGRCRLGWYSQVQENLLRKAGYEFEMLTIDSPFPLKQQWGNFLETLQAIPAHKQHWSRIANILWHGYQKALWLDEAEKELFYLRATERERGVADQAFSELLEEMSCVKSWKEIRNCYQSFRKEMAGLCREEGNKPYRVRIVGEIYTALDNFVNMELTKVLGSMPHQRVWVDREISVTPWFRYNILKDRKLQRRHRQIEKAAARYLNELVGGHGLDSVGLAALAGEEEIEGVIHIFPFTCMPEIVAQTIMTRVTEEHDLPLLTLIINEQTGEAGIQTRLEAFLDILEERRRIHRRVRKNALFSGY